MTWSHTPDAIGKSHSGSSVGRRKAVYQKSAPSILTSGTAHCSFIKQTRMEQSSRQYPDWLLSFVTKIAEALPSPKEETEQDLSPHLLGGGTARGQKIHVSHPAVLAAHGQPSARQAEASSPPKPLGVLVQLWHCRGVSACGLCADSRGSAD